MKRFFVSVLCIMLTVAFMAVVPSVKAADKPDPSVCVTKTMEMVLEQNKDVITKVHAIEGDLLKKYLVAVNKERAKRGLWILEAKIMTLVELSFGQIGAALYDENLCLVPGTFSKDTVAGWRSFLIEIGVPEIMEVLDVADLEKRRIDAMPGV